MQNANANANNTFNALYYVGDVDVTVQFTQHNANTYCALAVAASDADWEQNCMQVFNKLVLNKVAVQSDRANVAQNLLAAISAVEPDLPWNMLC